MLKKGIFLNIIHNEAPHFIAGTETWRNPSVYLSGIFLPDYVVFRNDTPDGYGGVVFACHRTLACTRITLITTCEVVVFCKISISRDEVLIIVIVYRLPNRDIDYMLHLCKLIGELYITL